MTKLHVDLDDRSYPIYIEAGIYNDTGFSFSEINHKRVVVLSNETVAPLYLVEIVSKLEQFGKDVSNIVIADGESYKTLNTFEQIMSQLLELNLARDATLLALGGGVIGDIGGFVAACYQRGIDFIQVPTTLLSQVDSSVGGKTAVNHPLGKNMIGAFYQPKAVYIDIESLKTLPDREFSAGMAEVIKYGIIYDADLFSWLLQHKQAVKEMSAAHLSKMIARCCEIKAEIVKLDEREKGLRALLNLGHTFGHAIESEQGYGNWLHGEAVAAGIMLAAKLSNMRGDITLAQIDNIRQLVSYFDLPTDGPENMQAKHYIQHMQRDKKVKDGQMRFILPIGIGKADIFSDVKINELETLLG